MRIYSLLILISIWACSQNTSVETFDIVVIGEGTGAFSASVAASDKGAEVLHISSLSWIGGMLTSAGVSATDGNHNIAGGLWREFRDSLRGRYGGAEKLFTGWVSNTMFEPNIGEEILKNIAAENEMLSQSLESEVLKKERVNDLWIITFRNKEGQTKQVESNILIDGTDLGDVAAHVGCDFDVGFESPEFSNERNAPGYDPSMIQDLTYIAILKVVGDRKAELLKKPKDYDPAEFGCLCSKGCDDLDVIDCAKMLDYGKLPNRKYMLNWPRNGNDFYADDNALELYSKSLKYERRKESINQAKEKTLRFVYYLQSEIGMDSLELDESIFPSKDGLPLMPYFREGRRIKGIQRLTLNEIAEPYKSDLFQFGIAVGDYPVDHHHREKAETPEIEFLSVPSYSVPLGALIPENIKGLIVADKAISVSNLVNGTTRLQPVVLQIGEAAGILASIANEQGIEPSMVNIRVVQNEILMRGGYIQPFQDVDYNDVDFVAIQKIGATGIMKGEGIPFQWANKTLFYPNEKVSNFGQIIDRLSVNMNMPIKHFEESDIDYNTFKKWLLRNDFDVTNNLNEWMKDRGLKGNVKIKRGELAVLIDLIFNPFFTTELSYEG